MAAIKAAQLGLKVSAICRSDRSSYPPSQTPLPSVFRKLEKRWPVEPGIKAVCSLVPSRLFALRREKYILIPFQFTVFQSLLASCNYCSRHVVHCTLTAM